MLSFDISIMSDDSNYLSITFGKRVICYALLLLVQILILIFLLRYSFLEDVLCTSFIAIQCEMYYEISVLMPTMD